MSGVGGRTIQEAQDNLSYEEYTMFMHYYKKYGSFNLGLRLDQGFGLLAAIQTGKPVKNFIPWLLAEEKENQIEVNQDNIKSLIPNVETTQNRKFSSKPKPKEVKKVLKKSSNTSIIDNK